MWMAMIGLSQAQLDGTGPFGVWVITTPEGAQVGQVISAATEFLGMPPETEFWRFDASWLEELETAQGLEFSLVYEGGMGPEVKQAMAWEPADALDFTQPRSVEWTDIQEMPAPVSGWLFQGEELVLYLDWNGSEGALGWVQPEDQPLVSPGSFSAIPWNQAPTEGYGWVGSF